MPWGTKAERPVKSVETAFSILERLKEEDGMTLSELDDQFELAKSTIHRHLATLHELEYIKRDSDVYVPSLKFLDYGEYTMRSVDGSSMIQEKVIQLADKTEERAQFLVEEFGMGVIVFRDSGKNAVHSDPGIGKRVPLHSGAAGKAILAHLPAERVEHIVEQRGLNRMTDCTIDNDEDLLSELERIRERGYSFNKEEKIEGLHAVGAPVLGKQKRVLGALSVTGPSHRMTGEWFDKDLPQLLQGTANELELNITYS